MIEQRFPVFQERFNKLRQESGMSQDKFAEYLGLSRPTIGFYENGIRIPDALTLRIIAEKCEVSADWLLGLTGDKKRIPSAIDELGLNEESIYLLRLLSDKNSDGVYPAGFTDDEYNPKQLINDILSDDGLFFELVGFCDGINGLLSPTISVEELIKTREELSEYRKRGIETLSTGELSLLRIDHAKAGIMYILDGITGEKLRQIKDGETNAET